jgi:hypothetical protein
VWKFLHSELINFIALKDKSLQLCKEGVWKYNVEVTLTLAGSELWPTGSVNRQVMTYSEALGFLSLLPALWVGQG